MAIDFDKLILKSIERVHAYSREDSSLLFLMDQIKNGTIANSNDTVYAEGKQGVRLGAFDRNKAANFTASNGYVIASALATQLGSEVEVAGNDNKFIVHEVEYVKTTQESATTVTLKNTPVTGSVKFIYEAQGDLTQGTKYGVATQASETAFAISGSTITLPTKTWSVGDTFIVCYEREVTVGKQIINSGDKYSGDVYLVIDMLAEDPCSGVSYLVQLIMPKAKVSGNFSIDIGDTPAEHPIEAESMLDVCSTEKELYRIVIAE